MTLDLRYKGKKWKDLSEFEKDMLFLNGWEYSDDGEALELSNGLSIRGVRADGKIEISAEAEFFETNEFYKRFYLSEALKDYEAPELLEKFLYNFDIDESGKYFLRDLTKFYNLISALNAVKYKYNSMKYKEG